MPPPRIFQIGDPSGMESARHLADHARALGFNTILFTPPPHDVVANDAINGVVRDLGKACAAANLKLLADLNLYALDLHHPLVEEHPDCFAVRRSGEGRIVDPRHPTPGQGRALLRPQDDPEPLVAWWSAVMTQYREAGIGGLPCAPSRQERRGAVACADRRGPRRRRQSDHDRRHAGRKPRRNGKPRRLRLRLHALLPALVGWPRILVR